MRRLKALSPRGRRKLSREAFSSFPSEVISAFARLPRIFKKVDIDRLLGDRISRSMKWRYVKKMESLGLVKHKTKKYYQKLYDTVSDWVEKDAVPRIKEIEALPLEGETLS